MAQALMPSDDEVNHIARQLYCPVCENISLDVCSLDACQQWRDLIRQQLADGRTEQEIKSYFVAQYGDRVLGEPPRRGLNWLLYLLPPVIILTGLGVMYAKLHRPTLAQPAHPDKRTILSEDPYLEKVAFDLENVKQHGNEKA